MTILLSFPLYSPHVDAQPLQTIYNTKMPSIVRVAVRKDNDPRGEILWVQTLGFKEYCEDVLPNEWMPSWSTESLRAGAIAIKMFGWYHTLHPVTENGMTFDVDNTTNFQQFKYQSGTYVTDKAVNDTWKQVYVPSSGEIKQLDYRAGVAHSSNAWYDGSNMMSQWGSQYRASVGGLAHLDILRLYYLDRTAQWI